MPENNKLEGGCHCGIVRFEVIGLDLSSTITCNCSRCSKLGNVLSFVPAESFNLLSGENKLTDYQFNKKVIHHVFCKHCGILSFANATAPDGSKVVALNLRCLDGFDPSQVKIQDYDGRSVR